MAVYGQTMVETADPIVNESEVTVAIPHHRGWRHLQELLPSLAKLDVGGPIAQVVVVDNASDDNSRKFVKDQHPWVEILALPENRFFAGALNECARHVTTPWIAFLNNDMRVDSHWLTELVKTAERFEVDCIASRILDWSGDETQFCGGSINLEGKGFQWTQRDADPEEERWLLFACGGAMLIRRELFLELGGFDPCYEMIYEDVDLGWRLNLAGYRVAYAPASKVYHRGHASLSEVGYNRKAVYFERNSLATLYKNLESRYLDPLLPQLSRRTLSRIYALSQNSSDGYATLQGVQAFWSNLGYWRKQRADVQARRNISDAEIPALFSEFLTKPWGYTPEHQERVSMCTPFLESIVDGCGIVECLSEVASN